MECERERDRRGEGRAGSYMVPRNPAREVADPVALGVGAVRFDPRQRFVSWHVVGDGQQYRAAEVQRAADEEVGDKGFVPREERSHRQDATSHRDSEECRHEGGGDRRHVDSLHGGDALCRLQSRESLHHEAGEREEDPGHHRAAESREESQHEE